MAERRSPLQHALAIRSRAKRLAALRALLPTLKGAERTAAGAEIRGLEEGTQRANEGKPNATTQRESTQRKATQRKTAQRKTAQRKAAQPKATQREAAQPEATQRKLGKRRPTKRQSAQPHVKKYGKPAQPKVTHGKPTKRKLAKSKPAKGKLASPQLEKRTQLRRLRNDVVVPETPLSPRFRIPRFDALDPQLGAIGFLAPREPGVRRPITGPARVWSDDARLYEDADYANEDDFAGGTPTGDTVGKFEPVVNLGFSAIETASVPLSAMQTLAAGQPYYLWLEIGTPVAGAINDLPQLPLALLPQEIDIDIVIFAPGSDGSDGFLVPKNGGRIQLAHKRSRVTHPLATPAVPSEILALRLFFPVTAPTRPGQHQLSCHLYYQGTLIQSHNIAVEITAQPERRPARAITAQMDYVLSEQLAPSSLAGYDPHTLSIAVGVDNDGSHRFVFNAATGDFARGASFDGHEIQDLIARARRAFRRVSWGSDEAWTPSAAYRYDAPTGIAQMTEDLAQLAIAGYRNYDVIVDRLGGDADALAARMRAPGVIQLALKQSVRFVLPLSLVYDHSLDADGDLSSYTLCEQFSRSTATLEQHPCFLGDCPQREARQRVVCPSGFWGFRHEIGIPPTLRASNGAPVQLPGLLACTGKPVITAAVSMDPEMRERDAHLQQLDSLLSPAQLRIARTRTDTLGFLREGGAHLLYFYCHGGVDDQTPYLQVGAPGERISKSTLRTERIQWSDPRALVFINGCHTTELEPERAIELVSGFLQTARSSGVIGTEITVFEPLATRFAELCLPGLLARQSVGAAIRHARLALLKDWNPLGLLYVPFAMATLRLTQVVA